jgi:hypothetical protein
MPTRMSALIPHRAAAPQAAAEWLNPIDWNLYGHFHMPWAARPEAALSHFKSFLNRLEKEIRSSVGCVYAMEACSLAGVSVPVHLHAALVSVKDLTPRRIVDIWAAEVGRTHGSDANLDKLALIELYDRSKAGIGYITKLIGDPTCSVDYHNVDRFLPGGEKSFDRARSVRRWAAERGLSVPGLAVPGVMVAMPAAVPLSTAAGGPQATRQAVPEAGSVPVPDPITMADPLYEGLDADQIRFLEDMADRQQPAPEAPVQEPVRQMTHNAQASRACRSFSNRTGVVVIPAARVAAAGTTSGESSSLPVTSAVSVPVSVSIPVPIPVENPVIIPVAGTLVETGLLWPEAVQEPVLAAAVAPPTDIAPSQGHPVHRRCLQPQRYGRWRLGL